MSDHDIEDVIASFDKAATELAQKHRFNREVSTGEAQANPRPVNLQIRNRMRVSAGRRKLSDLVPVYRNVDKDTVVQEAVEQACTRPTKARRTESYVRNVAEAAKRDHADDHNGLLSRAICPCCGLSGTLAHDTVRCESVCSGCAEVFPGANEASGSNEYHSNEQYVFGRGDRGALKGRHSRQFSYQRINHFSTWVNNVTAAHPVPVEPAVVDQVRQHMEVYHHEPSRATPGVVRQTLRALKLSKWYPMTNDIVHQLTGHHPLALDDAQRQRLFKRFEEIDKAWEVVRHKTNRKNIISYAHILHQICLLEGWTEAASMFSQLKGARRRHQTQQIWNMICEHLGWQLPADDE